MGNKRRHSNLRDFFFLLSELTMFALKKFVETFGPIMFGADIRKLATTTTKQ